MNQRKRQNKRKALGEGEPPLQRMNLHNPKELAATMLAWLPEGATMKNGDSKNLFKAFDLVKATLQHRTNLMTLENVKKGKQTDLLLSGVSMTPDVFRRVLEFLPCHDLVHKASLVSKAWLAATRSPYLWHALDHDHGLLYKSTTVTNMTQLLQLLVLPQFASLKSLTPPEKVQYRAKAFEQIAKCCPLLESLNAGYSMWSHMRVDDKGLEMLPSLFPHLENIGLYTYRITDGGLASFCERMGSRLLSIRIYECFTCPKHMSDRTLSIISHHCVNLERIDVHSCGEDEEFRAAFTDKGILSLLRGCRKLKQLSLLCTPFLSLKVFQHILEDESTSLERLLVVGHEKLMADSKLVIMLFAKLDSFKLFSVREHQNRIAMARNNNQNYLAW